MKQEITKRIRKRIPVQKTKLRVSIIDDSMAYVSNRSTSQAKRITQHIEKIETILWFDKHYFLRWQIGDAHGKRNGIEPECIEALIKQAIPYLFVCGASYKQFKFANSGEANRTDRNCRMILQQQKTKGILNVVIESHFIHKSELEITAITAMQTAEFRIADGQFVLEITSGGCMLKKFENRVMNTIFSL